MFKFSKIRKLPNNKYMVLSEDGKNLGTYTSKEKAKKRLKQIEYFKHIDNNFSDSKENIDLTKADEFAYSAIVRELRKKTTKENVVIFLKLYKIEFDKAVSKKLQKPEKIALQESIIKFNKVYKVKLDKDLIKNAAIAELGTADDVGKYLSNIVKFTMAKVPVEYRQKYIDKLKQKFLTLNESDLSQKNMPDSATMGSAITFVKHVLFNHDAGYIREVINNLIKYL